MSVFVLLKANYFRASLNPELEIFGSFLWSIFRHFKAHFERTFQDNFVFILAHIWPILYFNLDSGLL